MPPVSKEQEKLMRAAANNAKFAKKVGISQKVAEEFYRDLQSRYLIMTDEGIGKTVDDLEELIVKYEVRPDVVILDYIGCIATRGRSKTEAIDEFIKKLRVLAIQHDFCAIIVCQINREGIKDGRRPTMQHFKDCSVIEEHSDQCVLLYYPYRGDPEASKTELEIIVAKNKSGPVGQWKVKYEPWYYRISEYPEPEQQVMSKEVEDVRTAFGGHYV
jgi:replicative DNA helicase